MGKRPLSKLPKLNSTQRLQVRELQYKSLMIGKQLVELQTKGADLQAERAKLQQECTGFLGTILKKAGVSRNVKFDDHTLQFEEVMEVQNGGKAPRKPRRKKETAQSEQAGSNAVDNNDEEQDGA